MTLTIIIHVMHVHKQGFAQQTPPPPAATMPPTLPHPPMDPLAEAIHTEAIAKKAHCAAHKALQDARADHAAAIAALQEAKKAAETALQNVQAKQVVEVEAKAKLQLAQRALKRERAAADTSKCPVGGGDQV